MRRVQLEIGQPLATTATYEGYIWLCANIVNNYLRDSALQTVGRGRNPVRAEREDEDNRGEWIGVRT